MIKKTLRFTALIALSTVIFSACGGSDGAVGPKGDTGNANVKVYEFGSRTFTGLVNLEVDIPRATVDSSAVFVYYNPATEVESAWYSAPGLGGGGLYQTRYVFYQSAVTPSQYTLGLRTVTANGSGPYNSSVTFRKIRLVLVKASEINSMTNSLTSYEVLKDRFSLPE